MMIIYMVIAGICIRLLIEGFLNFCNRVGKANRRVRYVSGLFANNYVDSKVLFINRFKTLANISFIRDIDVSEAYAVIMESMACEVIEIYQYSSYDYDENKTLFIITIFVLRDKRMIELGSGYAEILFTSSHYNWANGLLNDLASCRRAERTVVMGFTRPEEINQN